MSIDLKQDVINAVRKGNCPEYQQNSHACWGCPYAETVSVTDIDIDNNSNYVTYECGNSNYNKKTYKVKPNKIKRKSK